jgi:N-acetylmuramoyl-L-alanine amidase CwlA
MAFNSAKYTINRKYINIGNARSGQKIAKVRFLVAHDIGKGDSTADENRRYFNNHQPSASAHTFIDPTEILEIVPIDEKAWHVRYDVPADNRMFGDDANDCAIGTELCHGPTQDFKKAYDKYVWYHAYLCDKFGLDPRNEIISHKVLDPGRRSDPDHALNPHGITFAQFIADVEKELRGSAAPPPPTFITGLVVGGKATVKQSATHYQAGQPIASFVKGNAYKILQIKAVSKGNSKKSYLLGGIMSWVLEQDIEESGVPNGYVAPVLVKPYFFVSQNGVIAQVKVITDNINIHSAPDANSTVTRKAKKGEIFDVYTNQNDWHAVGGANWILGNNGKNLSLIRYNVQVNGIMTKKDADKLIADMQAKGYAAKIL